MSYVSWGEQTTIYKSVETFLSVLNPQGEAEREQYLLAVDLGRYTLPIPTGCTFISSNSIFVSGGFELLQMVIQPDTEWYASEDVGP